MEIVADKDLALNPNDVQVLAIIAQTLPRAMNSKTPEPEKVLTKAEQYSKKAIDLTPTLLALMGLDGDPALPRFDGRPITEAFIDGPDPEKMPMRTITYITASRDRSYQAEIQLSNTKGGNYYVDKSWRIR